MGLYQSYQQTFVTNSPALLAQGKTVDSLAVGQIGILDGKTKVATTTPTYAKNKALYFVWGTPDVTLGDFGGVPNENEYTKLIKGKLIKGFRAKKAKRGQTPIYTIGWSGDAADNDTLSAKVGEAKSVFIKLTGTIIDRLYSKQGFTKQLLTVPACTDECTDTCADILCPELATQLADQINADKDLSKFIRAKSIVQCDGVAAPVEGSVYKFKLNVADAGDQTSLGLVQAQFPDEDISIIDRQGITTSYGVVKTANSAPASFVGTSFVVPDCGSCPSGYTYQPASNKYTVSITTGDTYPVLAGEISHTKTATNVSGKDVYTSYVESDVEDATFKTAVTTANAAYSATLVGAVKEACIQDAPVTIAWVSDGTLKTRTQDYHITLADDVCGNDRLADLQAAYPDLTVSVVNAAGDCVHTYSVTLTSDPYVGGCAVESITYPSIPVFEGASWKPVLPEALADGTVCKCGVQVETAFFRNSTNECSFDAFPYENDIVHVQISNYNPDFNADPCENEWAVKQVRQVQYPQGDGAYVQHLEQESKGYDQRFRAYDPVVRGLQGYSLQADPNRFYDEYTLEFETRFFTSGGWSEKYSESFNLQLFVPEGTGSALEAAINSYLVSAGIDEDGVVLP
jgi:hypothetical protein